MAGEDDAARARAWWRKLDAAVRTFEHEQPVRSARRGGGHVAHEAPMPSVARLQMVMDLECDHCGKNPFSKSLGLKDEDEDGRGPTRVGQLTSGGSPVKASPGLADKLAATPKAVPHKKGKLHNLWHLLTD